MTIRDPRDLHAAGWNDSLGDRKLLFEKRDDGLAGLIDSGFHKAVSTIVSVPSVRVLTTERLQVGDG